MHDIRAGLATNPALPDHLFAHLARTGDECVRYDLTCREDLTEAQARSLRAYDDVDLWGLVAHAKVPWAEVPRDTPDLVLAAVRAGTAPEAAVRELAAHPDPEVRAELVDHDEGLPPDVLAALARDPDPTVVERAAEVPELPADLAAELARHPHVVVRLSLAANDRVPPLLLAALLADGGRPAPTRCGACHRRAAGCADHTPGIRRIRRVVATNPAVPPAGLEAFLDGEEAEDAADAEGRADAEDGAAAEEAARADAAARARTAWLCADIAERTDLPVTFQARLAAHPAAFVRKALARNPSIGEALMRRLADDPDPEVALAVAENPAVPLDRLTMLAGRRRLPREPLPRILAATHAELTKLARSRVAQVRALVAARPDLPPALVERLAADADIGVAQRIAPHPGLAEDRLVELVERHGPPVYGAVALNPGCGGALLRRMAGDCGSVRKALRTIAAHPALPPDVVEELLTDPDPRVVRAAAAHPALPVATMERLLGHAADVASAGS
ncbi:hypothetical protein ACF09C_22000 [Streptomyces sp. NPDC014870]|uniref:hypothetical protein n=1 Tax=Streptomyces sp. NPDC014870 TaxID=3364925 RepID=UPI0036F715BA